jgi:hypothetical protein
VPPEDLVEIDKCGGNDRTASVFPIHDVMTPEDWFRDSRIMGRGEVRAYSTLPRLNPAYKIINTPFDETNKPRVDRGNLVSVPSNSRK